MVIVPTTAQAPAMYWALVYVLLRRNSSDAWFCVVKKRSNYIQFMVCRLISAFNIFILVSENEKDCMFGSLQIECKWQPHLRWQIQDAC